MLTQSQAPIISSISFVFVVIFLLLFIGFDFVGTLNPKAAPIILDATFVSRSGFSCVCNSLATMNNYVKKISSFQDLTSKITL